MEWILCFADMSLGLRLFLVIISTIAMMIWCAYNFAQSLEYKPKYIPKKYLFIALIACAIGAILPSKDSLYSIGGRGVVKSESVQDTSKSTLTIVESDLKAKNR